MDNHNHHELEQVEKLLQYGQPTGNPLLDDLAGTVPQSRPEFQQQLESQLMAALETRQLTRSDGSDSLMQNLYPRTYDRDSTRFKRAVPLTLAVAVLALLLAGLILTTMRSLPPDEAEPFAGAVQTQSTEDSGPQGFMWTATAVIEGATLQAAEAQMGTAQAQIEAIQRRHTETAAQAQGGADGALNSVAPTVISVEPMAQTATAMVAWASEEASVLWTATANAQIQAFATFEVPTMTPLFASIPSRFTLDDCAEPVPVYEDADDTSPVVGQLVSDSSTLIRVDGTLYVMESDQSWIFITLLNLESVRLKGWVRADVLDQNCVRQPFQATLPALPDAQATATVIPPPTLIPPESAVLSPICPPQQLELLAEPNHTAGVVAEVPFDASLQIEGSLTLNTGENWLLVTFQGIRGWLPALILPPECVNMLAPNGVPTMDKLLVPTIVPTASPLNSDRQSLVVTATPVPSATMTPTSTITASATWTPSPTITPTHTPVPTLTFTPTAYRMVTETVQVRVGNAEELDLEALVGQPVDIYIAVGSEDNLVIVAAARGVTVQEFVEVPMPNETRYVFIEAVIIPRTAEQAELLAGLAQTGMEMKLEPVQ